MALSITFYNTTSNPKEVPKTLGEPLGNALTLNPYKPLDQLTGTIIVDYNASWLSANYCTFEGKNYFITDRKYDIGQKMELTLKVDVLETYWNQIKNCPAVFDRSDTKNNAEIIDGQRRFEAYQDVEYIEFNGSGLTYPERIVMICAL